MSNNDRSGKHINTLPKIEGNFIENECISDIYMQMLQQLLKCMNCKHFNICTSCKILRNFRFDYEKYLIDERGNDNE